MVKAAETLPSRVNVRFGCAVIEVEWPPGESPARLVSVPHDDTELVDATGFIIRAPMVGTFYRQLEPGPPPFVAVGADIQAGEQVAIIEAMKLMNPVEALHSGRVLEVLVEDGQPVEYDQPLFVLQTTHETP
ncbi:acetyl-CoA carboxylase biotin carboxyl carrier protein [Nocardia salmonicida]|uniref:acetyl-CoA carboxylase biotin carboxyl carrier protein n=1 Tax=Nocardia salmonicida TaxID=53431 RepID=UPI003CF28D3F